MCEKYMIEVWRLDNKVVYTPRVRDGLFFFNFWFDMLPTYPSGPMFMLSTRGHCETEEEARGIIEKHKLDTIAQEKFDRECRELKKKFGKTRTICVD